MTSAAMPRATRREWLGLAVLMLPTLLIVMDLSVLHLAVPSISEDLQPTSTQLLWIIDIYGFMIAGCLITMGTLGDRIGRRKLLLIGGAAFGAASFVAAFAQTAEMLILSRAALGVAGATLMPSTMSLIRNMFVNPLERTTAIGVWVSGFSLGGAIGPLVGGFLLEHFWWGSVFLINVPIMLLLLILGRLLLPEFKDPNPGKLDLVSAALSLIAVLAVIFGLKQVAQDGIGWMPILIVVIGLVVGFIFVRRQQVLEDPFIDLNLFRIPAFSASLATYTLAIFAAFGVFLFIAQYLQLVVGLSPLQAGLFSLPGAITSVIGSNTAPILVRRVRPAFIIATGLALGAFGFGLLSQIGADSPITIVFAWAIMSFGFGLTFTLTADLVVGSAPAERAGAASAISETGAELGGALGIALLGSLGIAIYRGIVSQALPPGIPVESVAAALETLGGAVVVSEQLPAQLGDALLEITRSAFVQGLRVISLISLGIMLFLTIMTAIALRNVRPGGEVEPETGDTTNRTETVPGAAAAPAEH